MILIYQILLRNNINGGQQQSRPKRNVCSHCARANDQQTTETRRKKRIKIEIIKTHLISASTKKTAHDFQNGIEIAPMSYWNKIKQCAEN